MTSTGQDQFRSQMRREGRAYRSSGKWFALALALLVAGVVVYLLGGGAIAAPLFLGAIVVGFYGMHRHEKAGGDTTGMWAS